MEPEKDLKPELDKNIYNFPNLYSIYMTTYSFTYSPITVIVQKHYFHFYKATNVTNKSQLSWKKKVLIISFKSFPLVNVNENRMIKIIHFNPPLQLFQFE